MIPALLISAALVLLTCVIHYEALGWLSARLPRMAIAPRAKVLLVMLVAFVAHAVEIAIYGLAYLASVRWIDPGGLHSLLPVPPGTGPAPLGWEDCLYFSAVAFTSLGFGDIAPAGPLRLVTGVEALNGLLLIAWTASFTYLSMERFWAERPAPAGTRRHPPAP